eukprot:COSAG06_NODE_9310_length_1931_cov_71.969432_2_plen_51_part_00
MAPEDRARFEAAEAEARLAADEKARQKKLKLEKARGKKKDKTGKQAKKPS